MNFWNKVDVKVWIKSTLFLPKIWIFWILHEYEKYQCLFIEVMTINKQKQMYILKITNKNLRDAKKQKIDEQYTNTCLLAEVRWFGEVTCTPQGQSYCLLF